VYIKIEEYDEFVLLEEFEEVRWFGPCSISIFWLGGVQVFVGISMPHRVVKGVVDRNKATRHSTSLRDRVVEIIVCLGRFFGEVPRSYLYDAQLFSEWSPNRWSWLEGLLENWIGE